MLLDLTALMLTCLLLLGVYAENNTASIGGTPDTLYLHYTFYGWIDNCPSGSYMLYPRPGSTTLQAQGDGTYENPISFAGASNKHAKWYIAPHTRIYIPALEKYFIMEDECSECNREKKFAIDLWMGPANFTEGIVDCENQMTLDDNTKVEVLVDPKAGYPVNTVPFYDGHKCLEEVDPSNHCTPYKPVTRGCNICQLNWDAKPADGSGQQVYPEEGLTCVELAEIFQSSVQRLEQLNPSWDCGADGSKRIPYSDDDFCQGDSCGSP